jgi:mono/diheme cytochrome c family protein
MRRIPMLALLGCLAAATPVDAQPGQAEVLWRRRCAMCHGSEGDGRTQMGERYGLGDFTSPAWQRARSDEQIRAAILDGGRGMPAFRSRLSRAQLDALVELIRSFSSSRPLPAESPH